MLEYVSTCSSHMLEYVSAHHGSVTFWLMCPLCPRWCGSETRSQNTEKLSVDEATSLLLNLLQQARQGVEDMPAEVYLQELPLWKRQYF
ncbi:uncharacterized protein LOC129408912 isoform X1 [Boleophthalmus pectinirostris]|uniref:uncharacterized protein LOC129408912 isoform X1 n=1 Tax=Boleophthalmus pectinirostris TaxID=150288 RepID=UPI002430204E|nr:uncharacterized protein LOC129408912 isoform X1 [Boleophthalmus pectinirostris]